MKFIEFLVETKLYVGNIFEIIAALAGVWYLKKTKNPPLEIKFFVYYLILIVILELYGYLPILAYLEDYKILSFYKDSLFRRNLWWGNILRVITTLCISWIFIRKLKNNRIRKKLIYLLLIFPVLSIVSFFTIGEFFHASDPFVNILGVFLILTSVGFYYFQLLNSKRILNFYADLRFYISVGIVIWNLCMVPLNIYSNFFSLENPLYIKLDTIAHMYANIFLYSIFATGFYIDYRFNKVKPQNTRV